jgi:hypothetical protein
LRCELEDFAFPQMSVSRDQNPPIRPRPRH